MPDDSQCQDGSNRHKQPEPIPVTERLGKSIRVEHVAGRFEAIWIQPRGEPVRADRGDTDQCADKDARPVASAEHKCDGHCDRHVDEHALGLPD